MSTKTKRESQKLPDIISGTYDARLRMVLKCEI